MNTIYSRLTDSELVREAEHLDNNGGLHPIAIELAERLSVTGERNRYLEEVLESSDIEFD